MTHNEFNNFLEQIPRLGPEEMRQLRQALDNALAETDEYAPLNPAEKEDLELQRRLFSVGLLSEIKPPIRDLTPYRNRSTLTIEGEPLSETVIRERR